MKQTLFWVYFTSGEKVHEWAFCEEQAKILAQARNINNAKPYDVEKVERQNERR